MIAHLHIPKCAGNSVCQHLTDKNIDHWLSYTRTIPFAIVSEITGSGDFIRSKKYFEHYSDFLGNPEIVIGHGIWKGIDDYFPEVSDVEYHTILRNPIDRVISIYRFVKARYTRGDLGPTIYKEGGSLVDFAANSRRIFEKEDGTERSFVEWFESLSSRTIDEYDITSYENTLSVRGLTTDDFTWIGNESSLGNLPIVNVSPAYDVPERTAIEELVNTHWPNDMAIYSASFAYNGITPDYLL